MRCEKGLILGDPGEDSGGEGKSRWAEKVLFLVPYFSARLDFPSPPLSAPGSPRMIVPLPSKPFETQLVMTEENNGID